MNTYIYIYIYIYIYVYTSFVTETVRTFFFWFLSLVFLFLFFFFVWFLSWQDFFFFFSYFLYISYFHGFCRWTFGGFCRRRRIQNFRMYRAIPRFFLCFYDWFSSLFFFMVSVVAGTNILMVSVVGYFYGFRRGKERFLMVSVVILFLKMFPAATGPRLSLRRKPYKNLRTFP